MQQPKIKNLLYFFESYAGYPSARHVHPTNLAMWDSFTQQETTSTRLAVINEIDWLLAQDQTTIKSIRKSLNSACIQGVIYFKKDQQLIQFLQDMRQQLGNQSIDLLFFCSKQLDEKRVIEHVYNYFDVLLASVDYPSDKAKSFMMCTEYLGNYPLGILISFRIIWQKKIDTLAFCRFLAKEENCNILLDNIKNETAYTLILPSQSTKEVTVKVVGETFNIS